MTIYFCVLGSKTTQLNWDNPFLPRIGEHIFLPDFIEDGAFNDDTAIIEDIQWSVINDEICPVFFLSFDNKDKLRFELN